MFLDSLLPNRPIEESSPQKNKILCIIEGDTEFRYITKMFKLNGYINSTQHKDCFNLSENYIKIAWGKKFTPNINIVKETKKGCTFEGGNSGSETLPFQAVSAFEMYKSDLSIFDSLIVLFDADEDKGNKVQEYFEKALINIDIDNTLIVSEPCFESSLIDFCTCGECKNKINLLKNTKVPCDKFKNNLKNLKCFEISKSANGFISNINEENLISLATTNSKLNTINHLVAKYMKKNS